MPRRAKASSSLFTDDDLHFFNEGTHERLWEKLGSHPGVVDGSWGTHFAVWAPNAKSVSVIGSFNHWDAGATPMRMIGGSGIWEAFVAGVGHGALYKFHVESAAGQFVDKADPFAMRHEPSPAAASIVWTPEYRFGDQAYVEARKQQSQLDTPMSIYEVHLGSWQRGPDGSFLGYRELAKRLGDYVTELGYTHVELLPIMEHPFYGSWGYQITGYFAPTERYGTPEDFMAFVDHLHQRGIGVILDWAPAHFPNDAHGLAQFDGTHLFEHADPRRGFHPDWKSAIFNYGRHEVRAFLVSSANYWIEMFHVDGLRVDGVASMLYLDYSRKEGEWLPNENGGRENLEAVAFLRQLNESLHRNHPGVAVIAEESTSWPMVSRPTYMGGLGFGMKWDMGWMHDSLRYLERDPIHRRFHHNELTFRPVYAFHENFVLPLSHDEVVHGKGSLLNKLPGDRWQKFANLRLLFASQYAQPGKKLMFMGSEFGQWREWNHDEELDWALLEEGSHQSLRALVKDLNRLHRDEPSLHQRDCEKDGFRWVDGTDAERSVIAFLRLGRPGDLPVLAVFNFTPVVRADYVVGVPRPGLWTEILNTDAETYGGSGVGNLGGLQSHSGLVDGYAQHLAITLPPLACVFFRAPIDEHDGSITTR